jgi:hypothetical protein
MCALSLLITGGALATDFTWKASPSSSDWTNTANWDCGGCGEYPDDSGDTATLSGGTPHPNLNANVTVGMLLVGGNQLSIPSGKTLTVTGADGFRIATGKVLVTGGTLRLEGGGLVRINGGSTSNQIRFEDTTGGHLEFAGDKPYEIVSEKDDLLYVIFGKVHGTIDGSEDEPVVVFGGALSGTLTINAFLVNNGLIRVVGDDAQNSLPVPINLSTHPKMGTGKVVIYSGEGSSQARIVTDVPVVGDGCQLTFLEGNTLLDIGRPWVTCGELEMKRFGTSTLYPTARTATGMIAEWQRCATGCHSGFCPGCGTCPAILGD